MGVTETEPECDTAPTVGLIETLVQPTPAHVRVAVLPAVMVAGLALRVTVGVALVAGVVCAT